jgi:hypothetical protein
MKNKFIISIFICIFLFSLTSSLDTSYTDYTSQILGESDGSKTFEGRNVYLQTVGENVNIHFLEDDSEFNVNGVVFENIAPRGEWEDAFILIDEQGDIIEADLTASDLTNFVFDNKIYSVEEGTRVVYREGIVEIFPKDKGEILLEFIDANGDTVNQRFVPLSGFEDRLRFDGEEVLFRGEFDFDNFKVSAPQLSSYCIGTLAQENCARTGLTSLIFDEDANSLVVHARGDNNLELSFDDEQLGGLVVDYIEDGSVVDVKIENSNNHFFKRDAEYHFSNNPPTTSSTLSHNTIVAHEYEFEGKNYPFVSWDGNLFNGVDLIGGSAGLDRINFEDIEFQTTKGDVLSFTQQDPLGSEFVSPSEYLNQKVSDALLYPARRMAYFFASNSLGNPHLSFDQVIGTIRHLKSGSYTGDANNYDDIFTPDLLSIYLKLAPNPFKESPHRPASLTKYSDVTMYSIKEFSEIYPLDRQKPAMLGYSWKADYLRKFLQIRPNEQEDIITLLATNVDDSMYSPSGFSPYVSHLDLGQHTISFGRDDKGIYMSILDVWDFRSDGGRYSSRKHELGSPLFNALQERAMTSLGEPFGFYDRYYISDEEIIAELERRDRLDIGE